MKFIFTLTRSEEGIFLPLHYQYEISVAIYSILQKADPEYSQFLQIEGFNFGNKGSKPFTFSMLEFDDFDFHPDSHQIEHTRTRGSVGY